MRKIQFIAFAGLLFRMSIAKKETPQIDADSIIGPIMEPIAALFTEIDKNDRALQMAHKIEQQRKASSFDPESLLSALIPKEDGPSTTPPSYLNQLFEPMKKEFEKFQKSLTTKDPAPTKSIEVPMRPTEKVDIRRAPLPNKNTIKTQATRSPNFIGPFGLSPHKNILEPHPKQDSIFPDFLTLPTLFPLVLSTKASSTTPPMPKNENIRRTSQSSKPKSPFVPSKKRASVFPDLFNPEEPNPFFQDFPAFPNFPSFTFATEKPPKMVVPKDIRRAPVHHPSVAISSTPPTPPPSIESPTPSKIPNLFNDLFPDSNKPEAFIKYTPSVPTFPPITFAAKKQNLMDYLMEEFSPNSNDLLGLKPASLVNPYTLNPLMSMFTTPQPIFKPPNNPKIKSTPVNKMDHLKHFQKPLPIQDPFYNPFSPNKHSKMFDFLTGRSTIPPLIDLLKTNK